VQPLSSLLLKLRMNIDNIMQRKLSVTAEGCKIPIVKVACDLSKDAHAMMSIIDEKYHTIHYRKLLLIDRE
jgi:hypothetical protein